MKQRPSKPFLSKTVITLILLMATPSLLAQTMNSIKQEEQAKNPLVKKFHWGVAAQFLWTTIDGISLPEQYFVKPSLGFGVRTEYYFLPFLGVGAGLGYQQRGAGIINPDQSGGAFSHPFVIDKNGNQGDPDSTHLEKLRSSTLELPVSLLIRTPKDILPGIRLSASAGLIYIHHFETNLVFESIADGNHYIQPVTSSYLRNDMGYQVSAGIDIHLADAGSWFQIHYLYNSGLGNVFAAGQGQGAQVAHGIRLTCLF